MGALSVRLKMCSIIMAGLSIETLIIFIILKLDGFNHLHHMGWVKLVAFPFAMAACFVILYMLVIFFSEGQDNVNKALILHPPEVLQQQDPNSIEAYNEFHVFRDILILCLYCLFIIYGFLIYSTPCSSCNTPYPMLSLGVTITYTIRAIVLIYHFRIYYVRYNLMAYEVASYQTLSDENRFFNQALPDLIESEEWSYTFMIDISMFLCTLSLALFGTVWIDNNECSERCERLFHYSKYLLAGMYVFEAGYVISCLLLRFYSRTSGVETMQALFNRLKMQNISKPLKARIDITGLY